MDTGQSRYMGSIYGNKQSTLVRTLISVDVINIIGGLPSLNL